MYSRQAVTIFGGVGVILGVVFIILLVLVTKGLPDVDSISTYIPNETTKIFSADNIILADLHQEENRVVIPIEQISDNVKKTVVAMEDSSFYKHHGLDFRGILRALFKDAMAGSFVEGASTLTQQLARNVFLTKTKTMSRKLSEAILALQIERRYTKTEILEMYLNQVYWGHNAYGIESAAQLYFGKNAKDLNVAESAMLVGLLRGPEIFSPFRDLERSKERQRVVLNRMVKLGIVTKEQGELAYREKLKFAERKTLRYRAPYFTSQIVTKLESMYGEGNLYTSGYKVYSTLNYRLQTIAEDVVKKYIVKGTGEGAATGDAPAPNLNFSQIALMATDPKTGHILAMVGGADYKSNQFNHCTQALRQPGSSFKPIVYLAALQKGLAPSSIVVDAPVSYHTDSGPYSPQNYTREFLGSIPLRVALEKSINVVAIKLNMMVGPNNVVKLGHQLGLTTPLQSIISLPLGANEVTMQDMCTVYGVFANGGTKVEPTSILRIEDRNGVQIYKAKQKEERVADPYHVAMLVSMMQGVIENGTGRAAKLSRPAAGKTGTTSDYKDAWFIGFIPQMVCATWVGNDNNVPMARVTGGLIPAPMWHDFMTQAVEDLPVQQFSRSGNTPKRDLNAFPVASQNVSNTNDFVTDELPRADNSGKTNPTNEGENTEDLETPAVKPVNKNKPMRADIQNEDKKQEESILNFFEMR